VGLDEDAMAMFSPSARNFFFLGLGDRDAEGLLVGEIRPRESRVLCSVSSGCCVRMCRGGERKLGMLPRVRRVIAKPTRATTLD
jgi:hypothetical protein